MRARSQRTHFMGSSNRQTYDLLQKTKSVHERSFNKSAILQKNSKINPEMPSNYQSELFQNTNKSVMLKNNPFNGTNVELQSARFDKMNVKPFRYRQDKIANRIKPMKDYSDRLSQKVKDIKTEFEGKNVNTSKLYLLKQAIIKNNRDRVNFQEYFNRFAKEESTNKQISTKGFKQFVKSFGYDLNNQQILLFIKLNSYDNRSQKTQNKIKINMKNFIELCTKDNVYLKTLNLQENQEFKVSHKTFEPSHFQILRNKFSKLKEAFKIYQTRKEPITYENFTYTMKKLDINDLIMPKPHRDKLFTRFLDQQGHFNSQKLLGAIAAHYNQEKDELKEKTGFQNNLKFIEQQMAEKEKKKEVRYNLKKASVIEYERHLQNARTILNQIRNLFSKEKLIKEEILNSFRTRDVLNKNELKKQLQNFMMEKGYSFRSDKYESLIGYLDFDAKGNITKGKLSNFIFDETFQQAQARIQRQTRNLPPILKQQNFQQSQIDIQKAVQALKSLKQTTLNPEVSLLFHSFDQDKDGYISKEEFNKKIRQILVNQTPSNIQNLSAYFYQDKNHLSRNQFIKKYPLDENFLIQHEKMRSKSIWDYQDFKKSSIYELKQSKIYKPTKYSAWPHHLHEHNLSLIQAPKYTGVHINQSERFNNSQKHYYGLQEKIQRHRKRNAKIAKMSALNQQKEERRIDQIKNEIKTQEDKNFKVRLVRQQYNHNLIENYD